MPFGQKRVTLSPVDLSGMPANIHHSLSKKGNRVSWRTSTESIPDLIYEEDERTEQQRKSFSINNLLETSQWPTLDPLIARRRSSIRLSNTRPDITSEVRFKKLKNCITCKREKQPIDGIIDGPVVKIKNQNILPVDYIANYNGKIRRNDPAILSPCGESYTYEWLNVASDELAKVLRPIVEEELRTNYDDIINDRNYEPCIGIARHPCEACVVAIFAVWKLGLPYLPIKTYESPPWRISAIVDSLKPLVIIGRAGNETLEEAVNDSCRLLTFESVWRESVAKHLEGKKPLTQKERDVQLKIGMLDEFHKKREEINPSHRCISVYHRINGEAKVVATYVRTMTIWNSVQTEWTNFPYSRKEKVAVHASLDSYEFLGQLLAPLLGGHAIVIMEAHDFFGFLQAIEKFRIRRLILFPEMLRAMVKVREIMFLTNNRSESKEKMNYLNSVKYWFCTGAAFRYELARDFLNLAPKGAVLVNLFGSRELLAFVCFEKYKSPKDVMHGHYYEIIPMGRPVMNTRVYVIDQFQKIAEYSELGEIYVSNPGVSISPYTTNSQIGSFSTSTGTFVPVTAPNPFLDEETNKKKKGMFQCLVRTRDYGKLVYSEIPRRVLPCMKPKKTLQFAGNAEGEIIIENYRVNTNEIVTHLRTFPGIKTCHVMVYRPGTSSKAILAFFSISQRHPISTDDIHTFLRARLPEYLIPTLVPIPGLPIKSHKVNTAALVEMYLKQRKPKIHLSWVEVLGECIKGGPVELKAAMTLCRILYFTCGVAEDWAASHLDWSLTELRIPFTSTPAIYKELLRQGYQIEMKEFFTAKRVKDILNMMVAHSPLPAPEVALKLIEKTNLYCSETITQSHKEEIVRFFLNHNRLPPTGRTLASYLGLKDKEKIRIITGIWPLFVYKNYSIAVRNTKTHKLVAALLNADCRDKTYCQQWHVVAMEHPVKYRLEIVDQIDEDLAELGLINPRYSLNSMEGLFFIKDYNLFNSFEASVQVLEILFTHAVQTARSSGFQSIHFIIFDYIFAEFLVEAFNFEIVEYRQANLFQAKDGTKPFNLAPDHVNATVLYKRL